MLVALLLTGCGDAGTASPAATSAPSPARTTVESPASSAPAPTRARTTPASTPEESFGPSFGVDAVRWPGTLRDARGVLKKMPKAHGGHPRLLNVDPRDKEFATVTYGETDSVTVSGEYVTKDTADGKPELFSANNQLSAMFGLGLGCARGSYRGTAPRPSYSGGGPGVTQKPLSKDVWFSCTIDGAEGDESFTGEAVGWTSKKTAWLVVAKDKPAIQATVAALRQAARS